MGFLDKLFGKKKVEKNKEKKEEKKKDEEKVKKRLRSLGYLD
ncbi:MAG: hypothetical protein ACLFS3_03355 [Candidatus Aenigmatarchaeota archaeon]